MDELHELLQMKAPLQDKVFCKGCIEEIVNFALNKNICDECVQQMMDENAMLREMDEETGSDPRGETDPDGCDRDISKYWKAIEKYGVPKQCVNIPVTSSSDQSEGI